MDRKVGFRGRGTFDGTRKWGSSFVSGQESGGGIYCKLTGKTGKGTQFCSTPSTFESVEGDMCPGSYALGIILASKVLINLCRDV